MGLLEEITEWRQEERGAVNRRYFYNFGDVDGVLSGRYCFAVGRKGTGKTSIAEHIKSTAAHDVFVQKLTFRAFPFNRLYALKDEQYAPDSQYITIWKYVIYCAICQMMVRNRGLDAAFTDSLSDFFEKNLEDALSDEIVRLTDPSINLKVFSVGGGYSQRRSLSANPLSLNERVKTLEQLIRDNIDQSTYFVLFDELDEARKRRRGRRFGD